MRGCSIEVVACPEKVAFLHLRESIVHQTAAILRTLYGDVIPERFIGMPDLIALMRAPRICGQDSDRCCRGCRPEPTVKAEAHDPPSGGPADGEHQSHEWEKHAVIVFNFSQRKYGSRYKRYEKPPQTKRHGTPFAFS